MNIGAVSGMGTREVWLAFTLSFVVIVKPAGRARACLKSSVILSRASVEGILTVVPRTDSRSRPRSRTKSGVEARKVRFVVGVVFEVGREGLGGGKGAEEELLGGMLFMVSAWVSKGRSGGV